VSIIVSETEDIMGRVRQALPQPPEEVVMLGPVEVFSPRKGMRCLQVILKSPDRKAVRHAAHEVMGRLKAMKKGKIIIDVDPLRI
jgi:primosomal protein N'